MARSMEAQKYRNSSHKALPLLGVTLTDNQYCNSSMTNAGPVSKNEANFLLLSYIQVVHNFATRKYYCLEANDISRSHSIIMASSTYTYIVACYLITVALYLLLQLLAVVQILCCQLRLLITLHLKLLVMITAQQRMYSLC